jgi:HEAT repeat protein
MEAAAPLLRIIETEKVPRIRYQALYNLGRARAVPELVSLYKKARTYDDKHSIIIGLFNARADVQLIEVAEIERRGSLQLRTDAVQRLRLLNTPKAVDYVKRVSLQNPPEKR